MSALQSEPAAAEANPALALSPGRRLAIFVVMTLGQIIALLDIQIVTGALGPIRAGLSSGPDEIAWIQTAYLMAEIVMIPLAAYLARALSTRWLFTASALLFTISSLMCGLAWNIQTMVVFRAVQGFTGGAMIPTVFAVTYQLFEGKQRVAMAAVLGMLSTLAPTLGPTVGGWVNEIAGWRWLFFMNVPPCAVIVLLLPRLGRVDIARPEMLRRIDWLQAAAIALGLGAGQYVLEEGPRRGWFGDLGVSTAAWLSFVGLAVFIERAVFSNHPVVRLGVFRRPGFAQACALNLTLGFGMYATTFLTPVFLGTVRDMTSLQIGGIVLVSGASMIVAAPIASRLSSLIDVRLVLAAGMASFTIYLWLYSAITPEWGFEQLFWPQVLRGAGVLMCMIPSTTMALDGAAGEELHAASGLFNLMRNTGGAFGIAAVNTWITDMGRLHALRLSEGLSDAAGRGGEALGELAARAGVQTPDPAHALQMAQAYLGMAVQREAATLAFGEAFRLLAWLFAAALLIIPFCKAASLDAPAAEMH